MVERIESRFRRMAGLGIGPALVVVAMLSWTAACRSTPTPPAAPSRADAASPDASAPERSPPDVARQADAQSSGDDSGAGGTVDAQTDGGGGGFQIVMGTPSVTVEAENRAAKPASKRSGRRARRKGSKPQPVKRASRGLARNTVQRTIQRHMGDVEHCYGRVALKDPSIAGRIVVQWTLGRDGVPTGTAILKNTLKDPSVAACIKQKARRWQFPPPDGGLAVVSYPFDLRVQ